MSGATYRKSIRLNILLKMVLAGKKREEVKAKALSWGVTNETAESYIAQVVALISKQGVNAKA